MSTIDNKSDSTKTIEIEHASIHKGIHYYCFDDDVKNDTEIKRWMLKTSNIVEPHLILGISSTGPGRIQLFEGFIPDAGDGSDGTELPIFNNYRKRQSENPAGAKFFKDSVPGTVPTPGGEILDLPIGVAALNPNNSIGGFLERSREILMLVDTNYLFVFTSGAAANVINFDSQFYEVRA